MKRLLLLSLLLLFSGRLVFADTLSGFKIYIVQDNKKMEVLKGVKNELNLKPLPFAIEVQMKNMSAISLFAGSMDTFYNTPDTSEFPTCIMLGGIGIAEEDFNKEHKVWVNSVYDGGCNYWYYESQASHRFNQILYAAKDSVVALRQVDVFSVGGVKKLIKVSKFKGELYLVFFNMDVEKCAETESFGNPQRLYLKLTFTGNN